MLLKELKRLLQYLEDNLETDRITEIENLHKSAITWQIVKRLPLVISYPYPDNEEFKPFPYGETFDNPEKMMFNQFVNAFGCSICLNKIGDDLPFTIRPDLGCVLIPSYFGAKTEQVENNPPWVRNHNNAVSYDQIINTPVNDFKRGLIPKVIAIYECYHNILSDYPKLKKAVNIVLPDLQGPIDNLELIRGSSIFLDMYSEQEIFLKAMGKVTSVQIELARYFKKIIKENINGFSHQHHFLINGEILIRNDTSIMISPDMYQKLIAPFDAQVLGAFSGGIHSCGKVENIVEEFMAIEKIRCFDFGQSQLNDVEIVYLHAKAKKIALIRVMASEQELVTGNIMKKYPTGVSLVFSANSFEHAKTVMAKYKESVINK